MSEISECDDYDFLGNLSINVESDLYEALSTVSSVPSQVCEFGRSVLPTDQNAHIVRQLFLREIGVSHRRTNNIRPPLRTYYLHKILPPLLLQNQIFMGITRCGSYLMTYSACVLSEEDEWNECIYRYTLHWWIFHSEGVSEEIGSVVLFANSKIVAPLQIYICQWPKYNNKVLVHGLMKENGGVDTAGSSINQRAFVTVTAVPSTSCPECHNLRQLSIIGNHNRRCIKHSFAAHTSFDVAVPYPEFLPKIHLKFDDFAVFNTNNLLHALRISLDIVSPQTSRPNEDHRDKSLFVQVPSFTIPSQSYLQEQIIRDFADEGALTPKHSEDSCSPVRNPEQTPAADLSALGCMSPPLPTRIKNLPEYVSPPIHSHEFLAPKGLFKVKKLSVKRIAFRPFFSRRPRPIGMFRGDGHSRKSSPYEFVDDSQSEVEQLSQFRRKLLADKTYEFQENEVENILPFSLARHGPGRNIAHLQVLKPLNRNPFDQYRTSRSKYRSIGQKSTFGDSIPRICFSDDDILIGDMSGRYEPISIEEESRLNAGLLKLRHCFRGSAARFNRCFIDSDSLSYVHCNDPEEDETAAVGGYNVMLNTEVFGCDQTPLQLARCVGSEGETCVKIEQQSLDIEAICQSVANSLCCLAQKTFTFCNDYDIEVIDICPRSGDVLILLMMRIEGCEGKKDENSTIEQFETSVTLLWNLISGDYRIIMVVPPQKMAWDERCIWNPAREASREIRCRLPLDVTLADPAVRLGSNASVLRGASYERIEDYDNGVQFLL